MKTEHTGLERIVMLLGRTGITVTSGAWNFTKIVRRYLIKRNSGTLRAIGHLTPIVAVVVFALLVAYVINHFAFFFMGFIVGLAAMFVSYSIIYKHRQGAL